VKGINMSFDTLKLNDLKKIADSFGVEVDEKTTKKSLIENLEEEGITYEMYSKFNESEKEEQEEPIEKKKKVVLKKENTLLVKMDKANPSYTIYGHTFTHEHPFVAMSESDAQRIFDTEVGFRPATPREAQEFYN
jgi:ABC-type enterochelin transport system substrate-binding protein